MRKEREINVFSISFIDVFCCALGAMILIFVLNNQALTNSVHFAVEKYREKAKEAERERDLARLARNEARNSRDLAQKARDDAHKARDTAEEAEKKALQSKKTAESERAKAHHQEQLAEEAKRKAEESHQEALRMLEEVRKAKTALQVINSELAGKNKALEEANNTLQQVLQSSQSKEERLQKLLAQYEKLRRRYIKLEKTKQNLAKAVDKMSLEKRKVEENRLELDKQQQNTQQELADARQQYEKLREEKEILERRLVEKEGQLREREQQIVAKEKQIRLREQDVVRQEDAVKEVQEKLNKKGEKSLFGIRLSYRRIVFLVDKSGSIIQNNWKTVLIETCREILKHCDVEEFAIIAFSSDMKTFPQQAPDKKGFMSAGGDINKQEAVRWLSNNVRFGGSTHLHTAIKIAYEDFEDLDAIFLLSDGLPSAPGESSESLQREILAYIQAKVAAKVKTKIIAIAIGYPPADASQYKDIYNYLHKIADLTEGQYLGR